MHDDFKQSLAESMPKWVLDEKSKGKTLEEIIEKYEEMDIKEFVNEMTDISVELLQRHLDSEIAQMLRDASKSREELQEKLGSIWADSFRLSDTFYYICADILIRYEDCQIKGNEYSFKAVKEIAIRACQVYLEVVSLLKAGLADGAWARWRTLYELSVISQFIVENGESVGKAYCLSKKSNKYYEWARKSKKFKSYTKEKDVTFNAIYKKCTNKSPQWKKSYDLASIAIHASAKGVFTRFGGNGQNTNGIGAELYGLSHPAIYAAESLCITIYMLLRLINTAGGMIENKIIFKWVKDIRECYLGDNAKIL